MILIILKVVIILTVCVHVHGITSIYCMRAMFNPLFIIVHPEVCVNSVIINIMAEPDIIPGTLHSIISYPIWVRKLYQLLYLCK